jgi:hypothetical protein
MASTESSVDGVLHNSISEESIASLFSLRAFNIISAAYSGWASKNPSIIFESSSFNL